VLAAFLDDLGARMRDAKSLAAAQCKPLRLEEKVVTIEYTCMQCLALVLQRTHMLSLAMRSLHLSGTNCSKT
jgi:hypothetical protein